MIGHKAKKKVRAVTLYVHAYYTVVHFAVATDNNHSALRICTLLMETVDSGLIASHRLWYGRMACM